MRIIKIRKENLTLADEVIGFLERRVTPFGCSGKVDCPKRFIGKRAYLIICKESGSYEQGRRNQKVKKRKQRAQKGA